MLILSEARVDPVVETCAAFVVAAAESETGYITEQLTEMVTRALNEGFFTDHFGKRDKEKDRAHISAAADKWFEDEAARSRAEKARHEKKTKTSSTES
jgi:hypothetical protein